MEANETAKLYKQLPDTYRVEVAGRTVARSTARETLSAPVLILRQLARISVRETNAVFLCDRIFASVLLADRNAHANKLR